MEALYLQQVALARRAATELVRRVRVAAQHHAFVTFGKYFVFKAFQFESVHKLVLRHDKHVNFGIFFEDRSERCTAERGFST